MIFKNTKTKWRPLYLYKPVASSNRVMLYARYDFSTGLYEFKSTKLGVSMYDAEMFLIKYEPQKVLESLLEETVVEESN